MTIPPFFDAPERALRLIPHRICRHGERGERSDRGDRGDRNRRDRGAGLPLAVERELGERGLGERASSSEGVAAQRVPDFEYDEEHGKQDQREAGAAILLISEELEELLALSDRTLVIYEGKIMGEIKVESAEPDQSQIEALGLMMTGTPLEQIQKEGVAAHD